MLTPTDATNLTTPIYLTAPAFDEDKILVYRELYYDGFSSVIAARDLTSGAAVAIKKVEYDFFRPSPFPLRILQRRFSKKIRQHAGRMRALSHNSVLKLIEFVIEPNRVVIVTEMCVFGDLFNWMLQQLQLRARDLCLIVHYIMQALSYLHSHELAHGNLTPSHILFHAMSPQSLTIMPDLSIRNELVCLTGKCPPIVDCWAPERLRNFIAYQTTRSVNEWHLTESSDDKTYKELMQATKALDVWSVGCIAHIALTGKPPFSADSARSMLEVIEQAEGKSHNPMLKSYSPLIYNRLGECLTVDPEDRPFAENCSLPGWIDDDTTRSDDRNVLLVIEYDLLHTCRRYRAQGRKVFEHVFAPDSTILNPSNTDMVPQQAN
ncbi:unnamed protein product [Dicrocoelium dendriticum]|nr:unnamed protein product [Dicrocoelium dendriticum]